MKKSVAGGRDDRFFLNHLALRLAGQRVGRNDANLDILRARVPAEKKDGEPREQSWEHDAPIPVRIILRDFVARHLQGKKVAKGAEPLPAFIRGEADRLAAGDYGETLVEKVRAGEVILLLDGLDEVANSRAQRGRLTAMAQSPAIAVQPICKVRIRGVV